jgi:N6-L-threonylcarbamoyladenine synthase
MARQPYQDAARQKAAALAASGHARILAIETSCDETACAIVQDGRHILSNQIYSQIDVHRVYGGVVPEIASRAHLEKIDVVLDETLAQAHCSLDEIDAVAVTHGPGLVGALLVGVSYAKALAYGLSKPLIAVNHIQGHIAANYLTYPELSPPFLCLVVSGGHSHLFRVQEGGQYTLIGCTQDDAAGEAFDKAARQLSLPYPGGPALDKLAETGDEHAYKLPIPSVEGAYDFSFSGPKTAFINLLHTHAQRGQTILPQDAAASFRKSVVDQLIMKTMRAMDDLGETRLAVAGGVAANSLLRRRLAAECADKGYALYLPQLALCGDNAAMIASAAYWPLMRGELAGMNLNAEPALRMASYCTQS